MNTNLRERNRSTTYVAVQNVALDLMARSGFDGVTVDQVAAGAGVSASTVYRYFGTKEALVLSGNGTDDLAATVADEGAADPKASPIELFRRVCVGYVDREDRDALLNRLRVVMADPSLTAAFEHAVLGQRRQLADAFAVHRRSSKTGLRDDVLAGAALGLLVSVLDRWQGAAGRKSLVKMINKSLALLE